MMKLQVIIPIVLVSIIVSACGGGTGDTGSGSEVNTGPAVGAVPEVNTEPEVSAVPEVKTEPEVDTIPEVNTEPEVGTVPEVNTEPEVSAVPEETQQKVDLSWSPPSTRTDGSVLNLSDLEGYRIYSGSSPDELILLVDLVDGTTDYSITNLPQGTHYFTVTAYDVDGLESGFSEVVAKEVI